MIYKQNILLGALFILLSELMFASMGAVVKQLTQRLPREMDVFMRNVFGLALLLPLVWGNGFITLKTQVFHLHLLRSVAGVSAMYCFFHALANLPLADGMLLKMTSPIFMPLIAWYWLSESMHRTVLLAIGIGFIGVILVLNPGGEFNHIALIGLLGGGLASLAKVSLRRLGKTEPSVRVVFYFALLSSIISALPMSWNWQQPSQLEWWLFALLGLFGTLGQLLLTRGYAIAAAARVSPFTYSSVLFGAAYGYLFWGETLSLQFILGALLIGLAGVIALKGGKTAPGKLASESVSN
jgi:drug/metabolite transporter (DMT)-like permease